MTDRTQHVLDMIDGALTDYETSPDAMRWAPDPPPASIPIESRRITGANWLPPEAWEACIESPPPLPTVVTTDPVGDPGADVLEAHGSMSIDYEVEEARLDFTVAVSAHTGRIRITCGCGWTPNRPDGHGGTIPMDRGDAFHAWALHVPPAVHALNDALRRWRETWPRLVVPPGWDAPGGDYDWRWHAVDVIRDECMVTIRVRPPLRRPT